MVQQQQQIMSTSSSELPDIRAASTRGRRRGAPKCAVQHSGRVAVFQAEAKKTRKSYAQLDEIWKMSIQAQRRFDEAKALKKFREEQV